MNQNNNILLERMNKKTIIVKINRSQTKNALNSQLVAELTNVITQINEIEEIGVVIITGAENDFISGADIREMTGITVSKAYHLAENMKKLQDIIIQSPKLFISAIHGYCLGAGMELALVCDFRVADQNAKFGLPEINLGLIPGGRAFQRISKLAGITTAGKMIFSGEVISAKKALELNVIHDVYENALEGAVSLANSLSLKSKLALTSAKRLLNECSYDKNEFHLGHAIHEFSLLFDYPDSVEGTGAYLEKRKPVYQN